MLPSPASEDPYAAHWWHCPDRFLLTEPALAGKPEKLDKELLGAWYGPYGLAFEMQSDGSCSIMGRQGMCTAAAGKLNFAPLIGQRAEYRYTFQAGFLMVNDPTQTQPLVLQRMQNQVPPAPQYALGPHRQVSAPAHASIRTRSRASIRTRSRTIGSTKYQKTGHGQCN